MPSRVEKAIRDLTAGGCIDCADDMCPKHARIDAHIKFVKARHQVLWRKSIKDRVTDQELADAEAAMKAAEVAYTDAVRTEKMSDSE